MSVGAVPQMWKSAIIVHVFKKDDLTDVRNCRPRLNISYLIMERVIVHKMTSYFMKCNVISDYQHGFIRSRSTCINLLNSLNDWTLALEDQCRVNIVYIDFAKAFDSFPHE